MAATIEQFLVRHAFLDGAELDLVRAQHPEADVTHAAVAAGFILPVVAEDALRLADAGMEEGLEPRLPGLVMLAEVGKGARGTVYRAWQPGLRRLVAVKVFTREMLQRPEDRTRFVREARIAARLSHPSLMRAWDIGSTADLVFIVLEYVEGETLRARLERVAKESGGTVSWLPVAEAIRVGIAIADGLAFIAANGITHRDIKPANIQLNDKTIAKILDLGLARPEGISEITTPLTAPGTPAYISPEQARGDPALTPKADVYALGLMLYRMLAGALPFEARSVEEMLRQHLSAVPPTLESRMKARASKLPEGLAGLVDSMLRKDPIQRPEAAFVAGALRLYLGKLGEPVPEPPVPPVMAMAALGSGFQSNGGDAPSPSTATARNKTTPNGGSRRTTASGVSPQFMPGEAGMAPVGNLEATVPDSYSSRRLVNGGGGYEGSSNGGTYGSPNIPLGDSTRHTSSPLNVSQSHTAPKRSSPFRGWSILLLLAASGVLVSVVWIFEGKSISEREVKLKDREKQLETAMRAAAQESEAARVFARNLQDLGRAMLAEDDAGQPQGSPEERVRTLIEENRKLLTPKSAEPGK